MTPPQRVAVLGAGLAGLTAARRLALAGRRVDVYERWPGLGGQAATFDLGDGTLLERYYHHLFTTDRHIAALYDELGMAGEIGFHPSSTAFFVGGRSWPFTSPLDLLRFRPLPLPARLRTGLAVLRLQRRGGDVAPYESETIQAWITREMGPEPWRVIWGPLLRAKFGDRAPDISMAWLAKKLMLRREVSGRDARTERLGYPRHTWEALFHRLRDEIEARGGRVLTDRPAARVARDGGGRLALTPAAPGAFRTGHDPRAYPPAAEGPEAYDAVLATVPNDAFAALLDPVLTGEVGEAYLARLASIDYHAALCLVLVLDERFTPYYWTNVADPELPFIGLIEHTNWLDPARYGGRRILYVSNYLEPGDPLLALDAEALLAAYEPGLRKVNPRFSRERVRALWAFREPNAQPIVDVGYRERIPPLRTPAAGLWLANTTQIYPEDRGTNYAVRLGEQAAAALLAG